MNLYFDTSALVKYFHDEDGSDIIINLIDSGENDIWVLDLSRVEFYSAILRKYRLKEIDIHQFNESRNSFDEKYTLFNIIYISQPIFDEAENLLIKYGFENGLRALDSLHLSAFNLIANEDWKLVTSDDLMCKIVNVLEYDIINPLKKI